MRPFPIPLDDDDDDIDEMNWWIGSGLLTIIGIFTFWLPLFLCIIPKNEFRQRMITVNPNIHAIARDGNHTIFPCSTWVNTDVSNYFTNHDGGQEIRMSFVETKEQLKVSTSISYLPYSCRRSWWFDPKDKIFIYYEDDPPYVIVPDDPRTRNIYTLNWEIAGLVILGSGFGFFVVPNVVTSILLLVFVYWLVCVIIDGITWGITKPATVKNSSQTLSLPPLSLSAVNVTNEAPPAYDQVVKNVIVDA